MTTPAAATSPPPTEPQPRLGPVGTFVDKQVGGLQSRFLRVPQDPGAVAALARMRRAVGKEPGEIMDVLEYTFTPALLNGHPADDPNPSPAERAAHVAITLFALHQQSRGERMHHRGRGLGTALRRLHTGSSAIPDPIVRRFRMLGTADSFGELTHHLRGVVQLLRTASAPLDYGLLAQQLHTWQDDPSRVRMTWGRQFYRQHRPDTDLGASADSDTDQTTA
ncbi:type I-E CRISPR-associated protein Cse2/CasB [Pseudonocardia adelaidensis]|uniref:CRISPR system Cascade subunit CasB n=1 Tax=Pseudonocardia adelaidensis TaxID=648754 RepID=A0ABP9NI91_9PSEU